MPLDVVVETGKRRVFASVLNWPGWCRAGRDEAQALDALADYRQRYADALTGSGLRVPGRSSFDVVERGAGTATTEFGAPDVVAAAEREPIDARGARRLATIMASSWQTLDAVAADAPETLRKGPRGGGRDRDKVVDHVIEAEISYARMLGVRRRELDPGVTVREALVAAVAAARSGTPPTERGWPPRYAVRRIVWHVLDHAWEIEDRSET